MPRHYQRKTETKYKLVDLEKAVEAVKNKKLSLGKAATTYSVPKSTIHDYIQKETIKTPKTGRKAIFSKGQEAELEKHILNCCKQFYGLTIEIVRKIAFTFAEVNHLKHNFDKKSRMAGKDWFYGFKKRHPNISLRRPEQAAQASKEKGTPKAQMIKPISQIADFDESIPLKEIISVPQILQPKVRKNSRKRHSTIITSTPMKEALEEKEQKRKKKEQTKENIVNKNKKGVKTLKSFEDKTNKKKENSKEIKSKNRKEHYCLICEEKYEEPITEDWIMCYKCKLWAHEKCTSGESTSKGYLCDLCFD